MKEYEGDMKKYEENMNMELLSPYMDRGTWKDSEPVPLSGGGLQNTSWGRVGKRKNINQVKIKKFMEMGALRIPERGGGGEVQKRREKCGAANRDLEYACERPRKFRN